MPVRTAACGRAWQAVIEAAMQRMEDRYDVVQQHDLLTLWVGVSAAAYPADAAHPQGGRMGGGARVSDGENAPQGDHLRGSWRAATACRRRP